MRRRHLIGIVVVLALALLAAWWWSQRWTGPAAPPAAPPAVPSSAPDPLPAPAPKPVVPPPRPAPLPPSRPVPPEPAPPEAPVPLPPEPPAPDIDLPPIQLHKELIPREITIVRCYYEQDVAGPGMRFGFDLNGSGFTEAFHRMITVRVDALDVEVENLRLVTANQIHGEIVAGSAATTQYLYPEVLIRGLPVFRAEQPFGVVRRGEVLDVQLTGIDEQGQWGRFEILTNLDRDLYRRLRVAPTTDLLDVGNLTPRLPFRVSGVLQIAPGLRSGEYGLLVYVGNRLAFKKDPLVDVVRPNIGRTGSIEGLRAVERARRPGDPLVLHLSGTGFSPADAGRLSIRGMEFELGAATFSYVSPGRLDITTRVPPGTPVGVYGLRILQAAQKVFEKPAVFGVVPPNWLSDVHLPRVLGPGQSGVLHLRGRDLSPDFAGALQLDVDEPGLQLSGPRLQDPSTIVADLQVSTGVAPGDYLVHVRRDGRPLKLPGSQIIRLTP